MIGGPSAGLAFALEIYDSLSGRHLLRGHKIAVTGELDLAGGVHEIGGVNQKTIGAINAGADTFLVPAGDNFKDARRTCARPHPRDRRDQFQPGAVGHPRAAATVTNR